MKEEKKDKDVVLDQDKLISEASMGAAMALLNGASEVKIEYPDPLSWEERVALYNAENPDQHTSIEFVSTDEAKKMGYIAGIDAYDGEGTSSVGINLMDEAGQWVVPKTNFDRLPFPDLVEEFQKYFIPLKDKKMKGNYKIIQNEEELQKFIDFLPDLEGEQKFYYSLFARKKYGATEGLKSDKCQLKRGTTTKERMIRDFKKLEVELGTYTIDDLPINQESLVLYITPNPRDMHKAALKTAKQIVTDMAHGKRLRSPQAIALNQIQVTGVKKFHDIDIDFTEEGFKAVNKDGIKFALSKNPKINESALTFINTRGGFHILVELSEIDDMFKKTWYQGFSKLESKYFDVTMNGDNMIPVPGCTQSDYIPFIDGE